MMGRVKKTFWAVLVLSAVIAALHNVPTSPTVEDRVAVEQMLSRAGYADLLRQAPASFEEEIAAIIKVQDAVLAAAPIDEGVPLGERREPADLAARGKGLCYDRSRSIEKALRTIGIETRHIAVYATKGTGSLGALLKPGIDSHAISEAKTSRGWVVIDSNARWISLDAKDRPVPIGALEDFAGKWSSRVKDPPNRLLTQPSCTCAGFIRATDTFIRR
jgi:hypothetical protein